MCWSAAVLVLAGAATKVLELGKGYMAVVDAGPDYMPGRHTSVPLVRRHHRKRQTGGPLHLVSLLAIFLGAYHCHLGSLLSAAQAGDEEAIVTQYSETPPNLLSSSPESSTPTLANQPASFARANSVPP